MKRKFRIVKYPMHFSNWYRVEQYHPGSSFNPGVWTEVYNNPVFLKCKKFIDAQRDIVAEPEVVGEYEI